MKKLTIDLENCYGIKKLQHEFDFSEVSAYAVYAPNGSMKSSLAQTFQDIAEGQASRDRVFPARNTKRSVKDEKNSDLPKDMVLVVRPYDAVLGHTEKTSTLLVNPALRKEYEALYADIDAAKNLFLKAMKEQSGSKRSIGDLEKEISLAFTKGDDQFFRALGRIKNEVLAQKDAPFSHVKYDLIFDEKVLTMLGTKDVKTAIDTYIKKYNELLAASTYFKKGIFTHYNAEQIAKQLADNGFFAAKHTVNLNAETRLEITSQKELEAVIAKEKDAIFSDKELKKKFADIEKLMHKNATVRDFEAYIAENPELLDRFANVDAFKEEIWKSYIKAHQDGYVDLIDKYDATEQKRQHIYGQAAKERTQWQEVIDIFNERFVVPFKLEAKNLVTVVLGQEPILSLGFTFKDGDDIAPVEKDDLMHVLSQGEKKALYVLNILFEIEVRKKAKQETFLIVDDIADSFDYKNKYAIIQYLKDVAEMDGFCQIILTHNFDFFRTVNSRFILYSCCLMASKNSAGITLTRAAGIKNVFVKDWKGHFFDSPKKRIASIPFLRNLIEFTKGDQDPDFVKLTSLLHWKADSAQVSHSQLDAIYNKIFATTGAAPNGAAPVVDQIKQEANACLNAPDGINFENKIVLAIAIRLTAEAYLVKKINNTAFVEAITSNQTPQLLAKFKQLFPAEVSPIGVIERVILMTPEDIHLNAFMYEPILDMSDEHLRKLYGDVLALV